LRCRRETRLFFHRAPYFLVALKQRFIFSFAEDAAMPVGLSSTSVARIAAGVLAALWAMAALTSEYVTLRAIGPSFALITAIATNVLLIGGASLAFVNARGWWNVLLVALAFVTIDRIAGAIGSGAALAQSLSALVAVIAIAAVTLLGARSSRRS
jgi:hypothetical protein